MFSVRRSSIIGRSGVMVEVFGDPEEPDSWESCFHIEESFTQRCCMVLDLGREVVAEIRRKVDPTTNVILGKDVFLLCLRPGFDCAFTMGLVLVLDHVNVDADDDEFDNGREERDGADVAEDI
ncbi:hypothetical protein MLD38_004929 [Melastoma candidum]|uniref:Uncharacterized protein n=1 Tax=Melastoma candidum TaxID=119954 RepID=A0ACB9S8T6_9MYRT|nr:hypothetical protein MLD38_004929 [Melastoma candidum]